MDRPTTPAPMTACVKSEWWEVELLKRRRDLVWRVGRASRGVDRRSGMTIVLRLPQYPGPRLVVVSKMRFCKIPSSFKFIIYLLMGVSTIL
jgi:hypothetical protein